MTLTRDITHLFRWSIAIGLFLLADSALAQNLASKTAGELVAVLQSDSPKADKALACKLLAVRGSSDAVPALAPLLSDEQLSSWARIALESIPGTASDDALRTAAESLQGRLLIGTLNSIGVRRDVAAVPLLAKSLQDQDPDVSAAAAIALGRIGNEPAAVVLRKALATGGPVPFRSAVAQGCVLCAERFASNDNAQTATDIYDEVRKADVPVTRVIEATRGAILTRKQAGLPLLLEQLRSPETNLFQVALSTAREFPGTEIDKALAGELERLPPERGALLISAMADRKETVDLAAVLKAAKSGALPVRLAAIAALGQIGNATCVAPLLEVGIEANPDLAQSAKAALTALPDPSVDGEILSRLTKASGKSYLLLIELTGARLIEATTALAKALEHTDPTVRSAALTSLGATVPQKSLSVLIGQVVSPKFASDADVAQTALKTAAVRMPDREACAAQLTTAMDRAPASAKGVLLEILGAVGGTKALNTIGLAARSNDAQLQDVSSRLLGEWMTIDAAPVLLDLTKSAPGEKYQVRALRGYIRIARQFVMSEPERLVMCQKAMDASQQPAEKRLVLEIFKRYPSLEMLKLAVNATKIPELKEDATQAALAIAQKISGQSEEVLALLGKLSLGKVSLEIVKAEYGAGATQRDVTKVIQERATDLQLISMPVAAYNEIFGGDPAAGSVKQLKIQYRINGKTADATFAENALIILPLPK